MHDPTAPEHAGWFADVRRIIDVTETTPGIPLPFISSDRASFYFTAADDADDAREAIGTAETILGYALGVSFTPGTLQAGVACFRTLEALLPSGLLLSLVVKAEHMAPEDYAAGRLAALRTVASQTRDEIYAGSAVA